jgi:diguanylate cyclase (GGDEF)-like protein
MNVCALIPFIATIAYIPLLVTVAGSRPWQRRRILFLLFLIPAMLWSLGDYFWRSNFYPQYTLILGRVTITFAILLAIQLHCFASSFFAPGQGRWLPFAYAALALSVTLVFLGYVPESVYVSGDRLYPIYGKWVIVMFAPLLFLAGRDFYVFGKMLRTLDNPVLYNQIVSLLLGLSTLIFFCIVGVLPYGRDYPISHLGNLFNAFILSYAVIRHQLVDIRVVLRQGMAWLSLGIVGTVSFWLIFVVLHGVFGFQLDLTASFVATLVSLLVAVFIYRLRGYFFEAMNRVFQGSSYNYRQQLSQFTRTIHNVFSLKEQGGELLALLTKAVGIKQACLLFPETGSEDFNAQFAEPDDADNELSCLKLNASHPVVKYLEREQKTLTRENLTFLPEFLGLWEQEKEEIKVKGIELFMPLISRDHLIAILVLGRKRSGKYLLEDFHLLEDITGRVAVSMEKEYLREQLREREEELSVINRSSAIITSSLDIQEIYDSFIKELKKVVDVSWAAIMLIEESGLCFQALSSDVDYTRQVGERVTMEGSGTKWVVTHGEAVVEPDLLRESRFTAGRELIQQGIRSVAYLPLIAKGEAIGSFIVASRKPNAYSQRHIMLLEQLASQIAMPVENSRLYARTATRARIDELTGLFNRRSLDEVIDSEISRHSRYGGVFSLAILDLDSFKAFNDSYGHLAGDGILGQVGSIIKNTIRGSDQAFRYGGDEFAVLLPETTTGAASQVVERVRQKIATNLETGDIPITASIGLASWPADGIGQVDIIAAADGALYKAKRSGGNRINCVSGALLPLDVTEPHSEENADGK